MAARRAITEAVLYEDEEDYDAPIDLNDLNDEEEGVGEEDDEYGQEGMPADSDVDDIDF